MKRTILALAGALALGGCATSEAMETLNTRYAGAATRLADAGAVGLTVVDARTENRTMISQKKNGYGMDMGIIRSVQPVQDVVRDNLAGALAARGYTMSGGGPTMQVAVKSFFAGFKTRVFDMKLTPDIRLGVTVPRPGKADFVKEYDTAGIKRSEFMASGGTAKKALDQALAGLVEEIVNDPELVAALKGV